MYLADIANIWELAVFFICGWEAEIAGLRRAYIKEEAL